MKTLSWRHTDWWARNFVFTVEQQIVGQLTFISSWDFKALYTDQETELKFAQKSLWKRDVLITKEGKAIGEIRLGFFGEQTLKLVTGERFILSTSFWEQEVYWKTETGETIIKYQQATMSYMGKGLISSTDSLTNDTRKVLISSGVFVRKLAQKRRTILIAILIPIIAAASR